MPEAAAAFSLEAVDSLHGWPDNHTILASDAQNAYWLSEDKSQQTVPLPEIYGSTFQVMSSDMIRVHPVNPDLLLVSADYVSAPAGSQKMPWDWPPASSSMKCVRSAARFFAPRISGDALRNGLVMAFKCSIRA